MKSKHHVSLLIAIIMCALNALYCSQNDPISCGNFALPSSQQPGPLFSFGQNILDKYDIQVIESVQLLQGKTRRFFTNEITALYGVTDDASLLVSIPYPIINKEDHRTVEGLGSIALQGEYAYVNKSTWNSATQATIIGTIYFPSKTSLDVNVPRHAPFTGFGPTSFFLGGTALYTTIDWYFFGSLGGIVTTRHKGTKLGNMFFYQTGIGRNLHHFDGHILLLLVECDGTYAKNDILKGTVDRNSGSNTIYCGPSLWYSTQHFLFQIGVQAPALQKLQGIQSKNSYLFLANIGWTF